MGGSRGGGFSIGTIVMMVIAYFALKLLFGVDLLDMVNGGGGGFQVPGQVTEEQMPQTRIRRGFDARLAPMTDAGKDFVRRVLGSTETVWGDIFPKQVGKPYPEPQLVLFSGFRAIGAAAWRNRPWGPSIARMTRRSTSTSPSTRT